MLPLTAAQRGVLTGHLIAPAPGAYNIAEHVRIDGELRTDVFESALRRAVGEADALNMRIVDGPSGPGQIPGAAAPWTPHFLDLRAAADPEAAARAWMADDVAAAVDPFGAEPLFAHAVLRTGTDAHLWYHRVHHVLLDGFGAAMVMRRVAAVYTALAAGAEPEPSRFGRLTAVLDEEAAYLRSSRRRESRAFWTAHLAGRPPAIGLGRTAAHPSLRTLRRGVALPPAVVDRIRGLARAQRTTWPVVVAAGAGMVLCRRAGAHETVVGFPMMNRIGTAALRVPAMVLNVLPLRIRVETPDTLSDVAARVAGELRLTRRHRDYRYEDIARDLGLVGGDRRLFAAVVNAMPYGEGAMLGSARGSAGNVSAGPVADLSVNVYDRGADGGGLHAVFDANPACCTERELALFVDEFLVVLEGASGIGRATEPAHGTSASDGRRPGDRPDVLDLLRRRVRERPHALALDALHTGITYAELWGAVAALAARLVSRGVTPEGVVALVLPRGHEAVIALLAVLAAGAAYMPLDPDGPPERNRRILEEVRPTLVIDTRLFAELLGPAAGAGPADRDAVRRVPPEAAAYIIHTSGSTGRPKGVVVSRGALAAYVAAAGARYGPDAATGPALGAASVSGERVLQFASPHFDASVEEVFLTLTAGATLVTGETGPPPSVAALLRTCTERRVTWLSLPTAYWHEVAHVLDGSASSRPGLPEALRTVVIGGEAALPERVRAWRRVLGADRVRLVNTYGPTEACVVALTAELAGPGAVYDGRGTVPIGTPLPGVRIAVLREDGTETASGETGELYLMGRQLADGYHSRFEETAERFAAVTALGGRPRAYRTGDLARAGPDGLLCFAGRVDDEFKVSGHRVHPSEVEAALVELPGVHHAAVIGHEHAPGLRSVVAFVVAGEPTPAVTALRAGLARDVPAAAVPAAFRYIDALPLTSAGKIDRAALRGLLPPTATPAPSRPRHTDKGLQTLVAGVWAEVLGMEASVSAFLPAPDDDFFALGGQSLQTIQVANRLSAATGTEISVADVFARPTLRELAAYFGEDEAARESGRSSPPRTGVVLPKHILASAPSGPRPGRPARHVLMTGATGFVGAHLCAELLDGTTDLRLTCLVRGDDPANRLRQALTSWGLRADLPVRRVAVVQADLARPDLGLSEAARRSLVDDSATRVDTIVHAAAEVSLLRGTRSLRAVNIDATIAILELAAESGAFVHHLSTLSVAGPERGDVPEEFIADGADGDGYAHSKWVAETLLEQAASRGIPVAVHRLGRVTGARSTGIVNERDMLWRILFAGLPHGRLPLLHHAEVWTPADELARDLARLVVRSPEPGLVANHAAPDAVALSTVHTWLRAYGYRFTVVPAATWAADPKLRTDDEAAATLAAFERGALGEYRGHGCFEPPGGARLIHRESLLGALRGSDGGAGSSVRSVDAALMHRYLDGCVRRGRLPAPR
ncbi:amino acid adenylation domain-containing protein [Yinghuangia sp. YIM S09857]|uniref:amino acid adenylation domain-containing protein n=1 Tax=Yinghuangia sp. YIM S09857 TaxID=3436929 RepID=UPI003F529340